MKQTNLEEIKQVAKMLFLAVELKPVEDCPFICQHPFTTSTTVCVYGNGEQKLLDLTNKENVEIFKNHVFKLIDDSKNLFEIIVLLNTAYYMTFLKFTNMFMSHEDLGKWLAECWVSQEFPSRDVNVSHRELISWFKRADKKSLMSEEDYEVYNKLITSNKNITLYRGVSFSGKPDGLSWTTDLEKAKWFSTRLNKNKIDSRVYKITITDPSCILAYFNDRGEQEVILNTLKVHNWEVMQGELDNE